MGQKSPTNQNMDELQQQQNQVQTQEQINLQLLYSAQDTFYDAIHQVNQGHTYDLEKYRSNYCMYLMSVQANYMQAGHNLPPEKRHEVADFIKSETRKAEKYSNPLIIQFLEELDKIYQTEGKSAMKTTDYSKHKKNGPFDEKNFQQSMALVQKHQNQINSEITSVKQGKKKANEMNLRDGHQTRVDNEHMEKIQATFNVFKFNHGTTQHTLNLPGAQYYQQIIVQFQRTSKFDDFLIRYGNAKNKLFEVQYQLADLESYQKPSTLQFFMGLKSTNALEYEIKANKLH